MVINGSKLLELAPIKDMVDRKINHNGVSYGLGEAGYDIRLKQDIRFWGNEVIVGPWPTMDCTYAEGKFTIASAIEEFQMPGILMGIVHDKSTWARKGLSVFNTVIEPGFFGGLTLELVYHGQGDLHIPAGSGIAQVVFHEVAEAAAYTGKYQNQSSEPEPARYGVDTPIQGKKATLVILDEVADIPKLNKGGFPTKRQYCTADGCHRDIASEGECGPFCRNRD